MTGRYAAASDGTRRSRAPRVPYINGLVPEVAAHGWYRAMTTLPSHRRQWRCLPRCPPYPGVGLRRTGWGWHDGARDGIPVRLRLANHEISGMSRRASARHAGCGRCPPLPWHGCSPVRGWLWRSLRRRAAGRPVSTGEPVDGLASLAHTTNKSAHCGTGSKFRSCSISASPLSDIDHESRKRWRLETWQRAPGGLTLHQEVNYSPVA